MLPEEYFTQVRDVISRRATTKSSRSAYTYGMRLISKSLDPEDLRCQKTMLAFRSQLKVGTRNIFDSVWGMLRQTQIAVDLEPNIRKPIVSYPHPLYADLMHLGSVLGNERLPELTWGSAKHFFGWGEKELDAAGRCWWWFMPEEVVPTSDSPLIVKDDKARPMPLWQIEYIINSPTDVHKYSRKLTKVLLVEIAERAIGAAHVLRLEAKDLRALCDRIVAVGDNADRVNRAAVMSEIDAALAEKSADRLKQVIESLPIDPHDQSVKTW
jgi:hypothetical protein